VDANPEPAQPACENQNQTPQAKPAVVAVLATRSQARGAAQRVGGLTAIDRSLRQLAAQATQTLSDNTADDLTEQASGSSAGPDAAVRPAAVVVVDDGTVSLPVRLPEGVHVLTVDGESSIESTTSHLDVAKTVPGNEVRTRTSDARFDVVDEDSRARAETALVAELKEGTGLGLVDRLINKRLSVPLTTGILANSPLRASQITMGRALVALLGALSMMGGSYVSLLFGLLLMWGSQILSRCSEEVSYLRFEESKKNTLLAHGAQDFVTLFLFLGVAIGAAGSAGSWRTFLAGFVGLAGVIFHVVVAARARIAALPDEDARAGLPGLLRHGLPAVDWWYASKLSTPNDSDPRTLGSWPARDVVYTAGRLDFLIGAWTVLAFLHLPRLIAAYALVVGLVRAAGATGQLLKMKRDKLVEVKNQPTADQPAADTADGRNDEPARENEADAVRSAPESVPETVGVATSTEPEAPEASEGATQDPAQTEEGKTEKPAANIDSNPNA